MSTLNLTLYRALMAANVPEDAARDVAREFDAAIDRRYEIHNKELATRGDVVTVKSELKIEISEVRKEISDLKTEMVKWFIGTIIAISGIVIAAIKLF